MKYPSLGALIILCLTAAVITGMITDAMRPAPAAKLTPAPADTDGFRLVARISDLERELGHREAELDALADQLDSAVAELHAAGALLKRHGIEYTPDLEAIEPIE
jgi:hypothetical protein